MTGKAPLLIYESINQGACLREKEVVLSSKLNKNSHAISTMSITIGGEQ